MNTPHTDALIAADLHHLEDDMTCPASAYWRMASHSRDMERERDNAITDAKQWEVDSIRALHERNEARAELIDCKLVLEAAKAAIIALRRL